MARGGAGWARVRARARACVRVRARVRACVWCVRACVCACVCLCVPLPAPAARSALPESKSPTAARGRLTSSSCCGSTGSPASRAHPAAAWCPGGPGPGPCGRRAGGRAGGRRRRHARGAPAARGRRHAGRAPGAARSRVTAVAGQTGYRESHGGLPARAAAQGMRVAASACATRPRTSPPSSMVVSSLSLVDMLLLPAANVEARFRMLGRFKAPPPASSIAGRSGPPGRAGSGPLGTSSYPCRSWPSQSPGPSLLEGAVPGLAG
jgi:hypothetical protein